MSVEIDKCAKIVASWCYRATIDGHIQYLIQRITCSLKKNRKDDA